MDEVSLGAATLVGELKDDQVREYDIHPEDFGLAMQSNRSIKVKTPQESLAMLRGVLDNQEGAAKNIVIFNAGVTLYAAGVTENIRTGIERARTAVESGAAKAKVAQVVAFTQALART
jgi:anthranilate phosphoribosyltransferase